MTGKTVEGERDRIASLAGWALRHPFATLALLLVIIFSTAPGLLRLSMDASPTGLIVPGDAETIAYNDIRATFGDDVGFTVVYRSDRLFTPKVLSSIDDMSFALEDLDGVTRVVSLSTVSNLRGEGDVLNTTPLMPYPPSTDEEAQQIKDWALANELLVGEVLGPGGKAAAITAFIERRPSDKLLETRLLGEIEALLAEVRGELGEDVTVYVAGAPIVGVAINESLMADATFLAPISMMVVGIVLLLMYRASIVVVVPVVTGLASCVTTLGFMGLVGFDVNPMSVIIPSLLLVMGATEDIHLVSAYAASLGKAASKTDAIKAMLRVTALGISLTSLTTVVGFLTLTPSDIPIISEFGIAAAFGMAINFVITVIATPLVALVMPAPTQFVKHDGSWIRSAQSWLAALVLGHRRSIMLSAGAFLAIASFLASQVIVDNNFLSFFKPDAEVRQRLKAQTQDIAGASIVLAHIDTHRSEGLLDPQALSEIAKLTDFLAARHDDVLSYDLFIRKSHKEMNGGDPDYFVVPDDRDLIAQYTLLLSPSTLSRFVDFDQSRTLILVRTQLAGSAAMTGELPILQDFVAREISSALDVRFSGEGVLVASSVDTMSREVITNLAYVFVVIFILISLLFSSLKAGLLSLVPNVLPIMSVFGTMGLLGISLDTSVFSVAVIALGIAVDDTIHFMSRYSIELRHTDSNEEAIRRSIAHEFRPILSSSAALIAGFLVLLLADFGSIYQFGLLAAVAMTFAVIADLVVTPVLLVTTPIVSTWDLISAKIGRGFEEKSELLRGLKPSEIRRVSASALVRDFAAGETLLRQGDAGREMLLILNGHAEVTVQTADGSKGRVGEVTTGGVVGEMAFLTGAQRTASVTATEPVEVLQISAKTLDRIQGGAPRIAAKLFANIARILSVRLARSQSQEAG